MYLMFNAKTTLSSTGDDVMLTAISACVVAGISIEKIDEIINEE